MRTRVLLVDSSTCSRKLVRAHLRKHGFDIYEAWSLESAQALIRATKPSLMLVEGVIAGEDGARLLGVAQAAGVATIVISDGDADDRARWLVRGAEDAMLQPADLTELLLRIRRLQRPPERGLAGDVLDFEAFLIDLRTRRVIYPRGGGGALSRCEYDLARLLIDAGGTIVTRRAIAQRVMARNHVGNSRAVDVLVSKLRRKLDPDGRVAPIWSVRGEGYRFMCKPRDAFGAPRIVA